MNFGRNTPFIAIDGSLDCHFHSLLGLPVDDLLHSTVRRHLLIA